MMQPKHKRLLFIGLITAGLAAALALALLGLRQNVTYFYTPSEILEKRSELLKENKYVRLGGMVEKGSIKKTGRDGLDLSFVVTDFKQSVKVRYQGLPPDLFREGQGVVAEGRLGENNRFEASTLLAKHDEKYMPPELSKALNK
jgi:cytochrome c-type biogenesis protein CcmE